MNELIENYMKVVYKDAAPYMMDVFNQCRIWFNKTYTEQSWSSGIIGYNPTASHQYWDIGFVNSMFATIEKAYDAIEPYRMDTATYNRISRYIDLEWLFPAKVAISNFEEEFSAQDFTEIKAKFKKTCNIFGMVAYNEFDDLSTFLGTL